MKGRLRTVLLLLLKGGLALGVLAFVLHNRQLSLEQLLDELRSLEASSLLPWLTLAVAVKVLGICANALRWKLLLQGQSLSLPYGVLLRSYFVGRFFGIITPGTLGLDGFRLYDSIRLTRKPVPCAAVIAVDKLVGFTSLLTVVLLVFPFGWSRLPMTSEVSAAWTFAALSLCVSFAFLMLLNPAWTGPLSSLLPDGRLRSFSEDVLNAVTAYAGRARILLFAVFLGLIGHLTTALMYCSILQGLLSSTLVQPALGTVLLVALLMTCATLVLPTLGGEGVREGVFVGLLGDHVRAESAFLVGHLGFWIEKAILGLPGALIYMVRRDEYRGVRDQYTGGEGEH